MISPSRLAQRRTEKGIKTLEFLGTEHWKCGAVGAVSLCSVCLVPLTEMYLRRKKKKTLTRIFIILFGDSLQQCVQSEGVILHDPVGDAAEERVRVQPGTVVTTSVPVTAQHFLIKEALTC